MYLQDVTIFSNNCLLMCVIPLFVSTATLLNFAYCAKLISMRLQLLAGLLKEHKKPPKQTLFVKVVPRPNVDMEQCEDLLDIRLIQLLYEKLHHGSEILNAAFGVQLTCLLTVLFVGVTTISYFICMEAIRYSTTNFVSSSSDMIHLVGSISWVVFFLIKIFTMSYYSQEMKDWGAACGFYLHHYLVAKGYENQKEVVSFPY